MHAFRLLCPHLDTQLPLHCDGQDRGWWDAWASGRVVYFGHGLTSCRCACGPCCRLVLGETSQLVKPDQSISLEEPDSELLTSCLGSVDHSVDHSVSSLDHWEL